MKTVKEAATEYFNTITLPGINTGRDVFVNVKKEAYKDAFLEAFIAGVKFSQRWISVDEELPPPRTYFGKEDEESEIVLIKDRFDDCSTGNYNYYNSSWVNDINHKYWIEITHWRYIELK
jgi:hypothetical protein